jgi:putative ABC transport system permease protein
MTTVGRGIRNAFRNVVRTISVVVILGLSIGLSIVMLAARHSVTDKVTATLSSIGNTVTIGPPGYSAGGLLGKFLTTAELAPIAHLHGVTSLDESLDGSAEAFDSAQSTAGGRFHSSVAAPNAAGVPANFKTSARKLSPKVALTSLRYPGSLAFARQGLACDPKPCTPPLSYLTVYFSGSNQPTDPVNIGASALRIVNGRPISGTTSADVAMVSTAMARRNGLKVGSTFTAYGKTFAVAAIFATDSQSGNDTVVLPLPVLASLTGRTGQVFSAVVTVATLSELAPVTSGIERTLGPLANVVSYTADADKAVSSLDGVQSIALYSLAGAVTAAVVILLLVMVMIVRERKREIGILKAIGASNGRIMAQFTTEAVTFTVLGLAVGVAGGLIAASPVTSALVSHSGVSADTGARGIFGAPSPFLAHLSDINAQVGWPVIAGALAAAVLVAVLASAATTWMIGRIRPAEVLRSE